MTLSPLEPREAARIAPLLSRVSHSRAIVGSAVEGYSPGTIIVDDREHPTVAFIAPRGGFAYVVGGLPDDRFASELSDWLFSEWLPAQASPELVLFTFCDDWRAAIGRALQPRRAIVIQRKQFTFDPERFRPELATALAAGLTLRAIDAAVAERVGVTHSWASVDDFLGHGCGFCVTDGDRIVSSCHTIFRGGGELELDVNTDPEHQGKGLATAVAAATIGRVLAMGQRPTWSCWPFREASQALARKLGFVPGDDLPAHFWEPGFASD